MYSQDVHTLFREENLINTGVKGTICVSTPNNTSHWEYGVT